MSLDLFAVHLALRNRALSLVVATTGSTSLSATATGYHRAAGSFVTDGFLDGMEFVPSGFASNTPRVIKPGGVTASDITTTTAPTVEAEAAGRTLSVGIPPLRSFENVTLTPVVGRTFFEEDFVPATKKLHGSRSGGMVEQSGLYVMKLYGLQGVGVSALRKGGDALDRLFAPGTSLTAGSHQIHMRGDSAPTPGQIIPVGSWAVLKLIAPWWGLSNNAIAA